MDVCHFYLAAAAHLTTLLMAFFRREVRAEWTKGGNSFNLNAGFSSKGWRSLSQAMEQNRPLVCQICKKNGLNLF